MECLDKFSQGCSIFGSAVAGATLFLIFGKGDFVVFGVAIAPKYLAPFFWAVFFVFIFQSSRLLALIKYEIDSSDKDHAALDALRRNPVLFNIFAEHRSCGKSLLDIAPCVLTTTVLLVPFAGGSISYSFAMVPELLHTSPMELGLFATYLIGQVLLVSAFPFALILLKGLKPAISAVASTPSIARQKIMTMAVVGIVELIPILFISLRGIFNSS